MIYFQYKNKLSTFPIQINLSISKNNSTLYLIKMKLLQQLVDRFSSVNPSKCKFTNNYTSCSMLLHCVHSVSDPQITADVDCVYIMEMSIKPSNEVH